MSKRDNQVSVGNYQVTVGPKYDPLSDGILLLEAGIKLATLPLLASALEAAIAQGVEMTDAQYHSAIIAAMTTDAHSGDPAELAALELEILTHLLRDFRAKGMDLPVQAFETEGAA